MYKIILLVGLCFLISGIVLTYFLVSSFLKMGQTITQIQKESESILNVEKNMVYSTSLIGGVLIVIGLYLIKKAVSP